MIYPIKVITPHTEYHFEAEASCFSEVCDLTMGLSLEELSRRFHLRVATDVSITKMCVYDIKALEYTLGAVYTPDEGKVIVNHTDKPTDKKYKEKESR